LATFNACISATSAFASIATRERVAVGALGRVEEHLARVRQDGAPLRQLERGVGRAHLEDPELVRDRRRLLGGAGDNLAEVGDRALVVDGGASVVRDLSGRIGRQPLQGDLVPAGPTPLHERELLAVEHV
jgi:hypothetical protein